MSPDTGSPSDEPLFSEELGEFLRLIFHRAGHDLRVALRNRWGEPADAERIGQRNRGGGDLPDRLSRRSHDRRPGRGPRRVFPRPKRPGRGGRDGGDALASASRSTWSTRFGPRLSATTRPPCFSLSRTASSSAYSSAPLIL